MDKICKYCKHCELSGPRCTLKKWWTDPDLSCDDFAPAAEAKKKKPCGLCKDCDCMEKDELEDLLRGLEDSFNED